MKNLFIGSFVNFGLFFFFLINPNNIFSDYVVNWVFWITGILNVIFFVLAFDFVVQKNRKVISLQNEILDSEKEDQLFYEDLIKIQAELKTCEEQNLLLQKQVEKVENISDMYPDHSHGALK